MYLGWIDAHFPSNASDLIEQGLNRILIGESAVGDACDVADDINRVSINGNGKCKIRLPPIRQGLLMENR
ncbi:hypothetical protein WK68_12075 [Burkholderia ubonensis]|nr:hypothetical protein WK68_12075 [Burkholderia ubonensis]